MLWLSHNIVSRCVSNSVHSLYAFVSVDRNQFCPIYVTSDHQRNLSKEMQFINLIFVLFSVSQHIRLGVRCSIFRFTCIHLVLIYEINIFSTFFFPFLSLSLWVHLAFDCGRQWSANDTVSCALVDSTGHRIPRAAYIRWQRIDNLTTACAHLCAKCVWVTIEVGTGDSTISLILSTWMCFQFQLLSRGRWQQFTAQFNILSEHEFDVAPILQSHHSQEQHCCDHARRENRIQWECSCHRIATLRCRHTVSVWRRHHHGIRDDRYGCIDLFATIVALLPSGTAQFRVYALLSKYGRSDGTKFLRTWLSCIQQYLRWRSRKCICCAWTRCLDGGNLFKFFFLFFSLNLFSLSFGCVDSLALRRSHVSCAVLTVVPFMCELAAIANGFGLPPMERLIDCLVMLKQKIYGINSHIYVIIKSRIIFLSISFECHCNENSTKNCRDHALFGQTVSEPKQLKTKMHNARLNAI